MTRLKCCPACQRPFPPDFDAGGPVSQAIYDYIAKHPEGVTREQLINHVYAGRLDGGPQWSNVISVLVRKINLLLEKRNEIVEKRGGKRKLRITSRGGPGSLYVLVEQKGEAQ